MIRPAVPICDIWHRHIHERKLGGLTSLHADDAVLKSTVVVVLEGHIDGVLTGEALTRYFACGVCHSDVLTKGGSWSGIQYPRVPGHEVAGIVEELGAGVSNWKKGTRRYPLARWPGQHLPRVPAWRFPQLPQSENSGHQL